MSQQQQAGGDSPLRAAYAEVRPALAAAFALSLFINVLAFASPLFSIQVYDRVLSSRSDVTLAMISGIVLFVLVAYAALEHFRSRILVQAGVRLDRALAGETFQTALRASLRARGPQHVQILRDVDTLRDVVSGSGLATMFDAPWIPVYLGICFLFHPLIGLGALAGATALVCIALLNERATKRPLMQASLVGIQAVDRLAASLRNAEAIRGLGMTPAIRRQWAALHEQALAHGVEAGERGGSLLAASKFLRMALQTAVMGAGAYLVIHQEMSAGVMFATSLMMGKALAPIEGLVAQWKPFVSARGAHQRLSRVFAALPPEAPRMELPAPTGEVSVENLTVLAPGTSNPVVRGASMAIRKGEAVAVVGPTGSGKSSLARALVGAWLPAQGCVRLDGGDLRHYDQDQLGRSLGYLPQDVELFAGSVRDNISRFFEGADDASVVRAAELAFAHPMIQRLPDGYATQVGEDGVGLSGGQRQRVGLARALFGTPSLVVLDEPNANLDGEGDMALAQAIQALRQAGTTVVVVTHKPHLLAVVDKIAVMHEGMLRAYGPRDEILPRIVEQHRTPPSAPQRATMAA